MINEVRNGYEVVSIISSDGGTRASFVPEKGGAGSSLVIAGRELLFLHDCFWDRQTENIPGGWPFLFPICGRLERDGRAGEYLHEGRTYRMPIHGFGPRVPWSVVESGRDDTLILRLEDTDATRAMYPFRFEVVLTYRAERNALVCEQSYVNRGDVPMPYHAGFHPYFLTPAPGAGKESVALGYRPVRAFRYNERFTGLAEEVPPPPVPVTAHAAAVLEQRLTEVGADRGMRIVMPDGFEIRMEAELFPYIQLYTMPDKPFLCVEPWMGVPNALNTVAGARWLKPGQVERGMLRVWIAA